MNSRYSIICCLLLLFPLVAFGQEGDRSQGVKPKDVQKKETQEAAEPEKVEEKKEKDIGSTIDKASFLFGYNFLTRMKQQGAEYNIDQIMSGMKAAHDGAEAGMTLEEQRSVLGTWQQRMRVLAVEKQKAAAEANDAAAKVAMEEFAKQEGAQTLEDGVMYVIVKDGDGEIPEKPDRVKLHYKGTYTDGTVFDSTEGKEKPMVSSVMRFVPGFSAAIQKMKVGSKWKVFIRGDKAYGMRPPNRQMGPNRALLFDIELIEIMPVQ